MITNNLNTATTLVPYSQMPPTLRGSKRKATQMSVTVNGEKAAKRPYLGKCQYKTGKCFNERAIKRNGNAHSLCEDHRIKQNLNQRRSDRKYQKVHATRRRHRRAMLNDQISMAMTQWPLIGYQQQQQGKTSVIPVAERHAYHKIPTNCNCCPVTASAATDLAPCIQVPHPSSAFVLGTQNIIGSPLVLSFRNVEVTKLSPITSVNNEFTPSGLNDFIPYSFQRVPDVQTPVDQQFDKIHESCSVGDNLGYIPVDFSLSGQQTWSDDDIELLKTFLLA